MYFTNHSAIRSKEEKNVFVLQLREPANNIFCFDLAMPPLSFITAITSLNEDINIINFGISPQRKTHRQFWPRKHLLTCNSELRIGKGWLIPPLAHKCYSSLIIWTQISPYILAASLMCPFQQGFQQHTTNATPPPIWVDRKSVV